MTDGLCVTPGGVILSFCHPGRSDIGVEGSLLQPVHNDKKLMAIALKIFIKALLKEYRKIKHAEIFHSK